MRLKSFVSMTGRMFGAAPVTESERHFVGAFLSKVNAYGFRPHPVGESTAPLVEAVCARPRPFGTGRSDRTESALSRRHSRRVDHGVERRARRVSTACRRDLLSPRVASLKRLAGDRRAPQGGARGVVRRVFRWECAAEKACAIGAGFRGREEREGRVPGVAA